MSKKLLAMLLACVMALTLFGCTGEPDPGTDPAGSDPTGSTAAPEAVEIAKSTNGNPIGGFDDNGELTYGGDPSALVVGDTLYLYTGHDTATNESYVIPEYLCYSTKDLENWTYEGVMLSMKDVSWAEKNSAWAAQVARHYDAEAGKDMYYLYFCSWDSTDSGKQSIGVAVSDSPTGPFTDLGQALVKGSFTTDETSTWNDIDPTVWIETGKDGQEHRYLAWGNSKLYVCELNEDMISVKDVDGDGEIVFGKDIKSQMPPASYTEAPWIYRRQDENGNYYGDYYLFYASSWREQLAYATTDDLMDGKWFYGDVIMRPAATSNTNHPAVVDFLGETWIIYHNGSLPNGSGFRRVACIEKLEFYSDGSVAYVQETATGAGGTASTLTTVSGEKLEHSWFNNSSADDVYPYVGVALGSGLDRTEDEDGMWEIVQGKADGENVYYVSLESYNKPGLYITAGKPAAEGEAGTAVLSQDYNATMAETQTFKTVQGLAGEGVSFESVACPGLYLTLENGAASLTDGSNAAACSFLIAEVTE